ncbi:uncharacterized protein [Diadema antillarum]|uniref:uncharacterized protein n=1 Tax=Diadema antillarum TaxID=105358 RepID=UPI003A86AEF5
MEYYFYILVVVALFLKLGLYFCWYHMRRRAALAREVHIVMPDGTTRRAVVTGRTARRNRREDRQILAHADALQHGDNQGFEERPAYPHIMTGNAPVGAFPEPPPYPGIIGGGGGSNEWKLPKYEELPPPYTHPTPTETGRSASEVPSVPIAPPSPDHPSIPVETGSSAPSASSPAHQITPGMANPPAGTGEQHSLHPASSQMPSADYPTSNSSPPSNGSPGPQST